MYVTRTGFLVWLFFSRFYDRSRTEQCSRRWISLNLHLMKLDNDYCVAHEYAKTNARMTNDCKLGTSDRWQRPIGSIIHGGDLYARFHPRWMMIDIAVFVRQKINGLRNGTLTRRRLADEKRVYVHTLSAVIIRLWCAHEFFFSNSEIKLVNEMQLQE